MSQATGRLASHQRCVERISAGWPTFVELRQQRLRERERFGHAAERATEAILEDLFTGVLDWSVGDLNHQVGYADILLTRLGIKYIVVEAKHPGALAWNRHAVHDALEQARRYAGEQHVGCIAVSDGHMLYAADVRHGGLSDRVFVALSGDEPEEALWWLSVHGIYRPVETTHPLGLLLPGHEPRADVGDSAPVEDAAMLLHPKYHLPASSFAYVGSAGDPHTWHLPYLDAAGEVDVRRLPKAIQAILSNYRGTTVGSVPETAIPDVLVRLAQAANSLGKMPGQAERPAAVYEQLAAALEQFDLLNSRGSRQT